MPKDMLTLYMCNIRSILEYAAHVSQDLPAYLSDSTESIQRRASRIIFLNLSYQQPLDQANLTPSIDHRIFICKKLMVDMRNECHPTSFLAQQVMTRSIPYQLRSVNTKVTITMERTHILSCRACGSTFGLCSKDSVVPFSRVDQKEDENAIKQLSFIL